jgi:small subunit ribosomal protein S2
MARVGRAQAAAGGDVAVDEPLAEWEKELLAGSSEADAAPAPETSDTSETSAPTTDPVVEAPEPLAEPAAPSPEGTAAAASAAIDPQSS